MDRDDSHCSCRVSCCSVDWQRQPGQSLYTDDVQGQQCRLADLAMALDRVMSLDPHSVVPWWDLVTMDRAMKDTGRWRGDVALIRELIDETRVRLRRLREAEAESH